MKNDISHQEFDAMLCTKCLRLWDTYNQITYWQLCGECKITHDMNLAENKHIFKEAGVSTR